MFEWMRNWKVARAAATFDAVTLSRVYGQRARAEAQILAARARHDGRHHHVKHWRLVGKELLQHRTPPAQAPIVAAPAGTTA